jgi:hypothetical protein
LAQLFKFEDRVARQGIEFQHMHGQSEGAPAAISESPTKAALVGGSWKRLQWLSAYAR